MNPIASIIIPTRGGAERLPRLFAALEEQSDKDFEGVPVVDGDIDGSEDVIRDWSRRSSLRIRPVVLPSNQGRSAALNAGLEHADGEVLIRCDDDLGPAPDYVAGHVGRHRESEGLVGIVGPYRNVLPDTPYARSYGRLAAERSLKDVFNCSPDEAWRLWAGNVSVRRAAADRVGPYDESYRGYGWEDVDYGYRLHMAGIPVLVAPELTAEHYMGATTTRLRTLRALHAGAARRRFHDRHGIRAEASPVTPWRSLVRGTSTVVTERSLAVASDAVDAISDRLPAKVSEKLVALLVESADVAGVRHPERAGSRF